MLRARELEKKVRQLLRQEYAAIPALKKRARQSVQAARITRSNWVGLLFLIGLGGFVIGSKAPGMEAGLAFVTLWCSLVTLSFTHHFRTWFNFSADLWLLARLPVADSDLFRWLTRRAVRQTLLLPTALLVALVFLGLRFNLSPLAWAGLALVILAQWWMAVSVALWLLTHRPAWPYQLSGWIQAPLLFTVFMLPPGLSNGLFERLQQAMGWIGWLLPAGWVNHLYAGLALRGDWQLLILLLPIGVVAGYFFSLFPKMRDRFEVPAWILEIWPDNGPGELSPASLEERPVGPTEITDRIRQRQFLSPSPWPEGGPVENWAARWLKPSERVMADLMLPDHPGWSRQAHKTALTAAFGLLLAWMLPAFQDLLLGVCALLMAMGGLPWLGGQWQGFLYLNAFSTLIPLHALVPLSLRRFVPVYLKLNLVRHLVFLPVWLVFGAAAFYLATRAPAEGLFLALKLWLTSLLLQPALLVLQASSTTNDTAQLRWRILPLAAIIISGLALGAAWLLVASAWAWLSSLGLGLCSLGLLALYLRWFEQNRFDTCRRSDSGQPLG